MGVMGLFVCSIRTHWAIWIISFMSLDLAFLVASVLSVYYRNIRCSFLSLSFLLLTVLGQSIPPVAIRLPLLLTILCVVVSLLFFYSLSRILVFLYLIGRRIRGPDLVLSSHRISLFIQETLWTLISGCLGPQVLIITLAQCCHLFIPPLLAVLPSLFLFCISILLHLLCLTIHRLRVWNRYAISLVEKRVYSLFSCTSRNSADTRLNDPLSSHFHSGDNSFGYSNHCILLSLPANESTSCLGACLAVADSVICFS